MIRDHYVFLSESLDVKCSPLINQLLADKVITAREKEDISAERTSFRANEKLLSVLSRKSPQQFQLFLDALDTCEQQHVRKRITSSPGLSKLFFSKYLIIFLFAQPQKKRVIQEHLEKRYELCTASDTAIM